MFKQWFLVIILNLLRGTLPTHGQTPSIYYICLVFKCMPRVSLCTWFKFFIRGEKKPPNTKHYIICIRGHLFTKDHNSILLHASLIWLFTKFSSSNNLNPDPKTVFNRKIYSWFYKKKIAVDIVLTRNGDIW